jgi:branched-chain amino acid aminotransferase group I
MEEIIFLNGKFIPPEEAKLPILIPGFLYGWGLFETMRSYRNKIVYFDKHLKRIKSSSKLVGLRIPYSLQKLKKIIRETVSKSGFKDAYVRLTLSKSKKGTDLSVVVKKYTPYPGQKYRQGIRVTISSFRQDEGSFLARLKSANRLLYELSYLEAKKKGFDGSIILNSRGYISEGSRSNIFFVKDNVLFTPCLSCGCLEGITRRVIFDLARKYKIRIYEGRFTLQDLYQADEVFFTNSLAGIMPVKSIDTKLIGKGKCAKLTKFFIAKYNCLLK